MKQSAIAKTINSICNNVKNRPTLSGVHYRKDGAIEACDSHQLLILRNWQKLNNDMIIDPQSFAQVPGQYPDTSDLMPVTDVRFELEANTVTQLIKVLKLMKSDDKKQNATLKLTAVGNKLSVRQNAENAQEFQFVINGNTAPGDNFTTNCAAPYLVNGLTVASAKDNPVVIKMTNSPLRPFLITSLDDEIEFLLSPVRVME